MGVGGLRMNQCNGRSDNDAVAGLSDAVICASAPGARVPWEICGDRSLPVHDRRRVGRDERPPSR